MPSTAFNVEGGINSGSVLLLIIAEYITSGLEMHSFNSPGDTFLRNIC